MFISDSPATHTFQDFPYDRITTVTSTGGLLQGKLVSTTARAPGHRPRAAVRERVEVVTRERPRSVGQVVRRPPARRQAW